MYCSSGLSNDQRWDIPSCFSAPSTSFNVAVYVMEVSVADYTFCSNARTRGSFKPRNASKGTNSYQLRQFAEATLGSGSLRKAVKLPEGEDLNEWLAVNSKKSQTKRKTGVQGANDSPQLQSSTSITKSTSFTAPSRSSARHSHVQK